MEEVRKERESQAHAQNQNKNQEQVQYKNPNNAYNAFGVPIYNKYTGNFEQKVHQQPEENAKEEKVEASTSQDTAYTNVNASRQNSQSGRNKEEKSQKDYFTEQEISANKENSIPQAIIKAGAEPLEGIKKVFLPGLKIRLMRSWNYFFRQPNCSPE